MDWTLGIAAIILLVVGLAGQGFELRRMRIEQYDSSAGSPVLFTRRSNIKWYAILGTGIILWYLAERA